MYKLDAQINNLSQEAIFKSINFLIKDVLNPINEENKKILLDEFKEKLTELNAEYLTKLKLK